MIIADLLLAGASCFVGGVGFLSALLAIGAVLKSLNEKVVDDGDFIKYWALMLVFSFLAGAAIYTAVRIWP